jgi:hypothetical protein
LREQIHGAFGVGFEVDQLGLRLRKLTLGLIERGLESARVDLEKQIAFLDRLVVLHRDLHNGPGHARRDPDHIEKAFDFGGMAARNGMSATTMAEVTPRATAAV